MAFWCILILEARLSESCPCKSVVPCYSDEGERVLAVEFLVMERQLIGKNGSFSHILNNS